MADGWAEGVHHKGIPCFAGSAAAVALRDRQLDSLHAPSFLPHAAKMTTEVYHIPQQIATQRRRTASIYCPSNDAHNLTEIHAAASHKHRKTTFAKRQMWFWLPLLGSNQRPTD